MTHALPGYLALADELERAQVPLPIDLRPQRPAAGQLPRRRRAAVADRFRICRLLDGDVRPRRRRVECRHVGGRESDELLGRLFRHARRSRDIRRSHAAMQCASLLREAMWSMVSELHLDAPGVDYVAYTAENLGAARHGARRLSQHIRKDPLMTLPTHAEIVVIGGGIIGCSTAYHLARDHKADVVLLEQGKLTSGSTWHAAGLVGQLRSSASITRVLKYSVDLYKRLDAETGLATGWKMTGCLQARHQPGPLDRIPAAGDDGQKLRHGHASDLAGRGEGDVAADGDRRPGRRLLAADRRSGEPLRHHPVARQGRAHAWRQALRGRARHRLRR